MPYTILVLVMHLTRSGRSIKIDMEDQKTQSTYRAESSGINAAGAGARLGEIMAMSDIGPS